jgi:hypothetical protein
VKGGNESKKQLAACKERLKYKLAKEFQVDIKDIELGIIMKQ